MDLGDPPRDQLLADRRGVGRGKRVVDLVVGSGGDRGEDLAGLVVAGLDALEVEDRQAAEPGQPAGERGVDDRVHRRREDRDRELDAAEDLAQLDVGRLDRVGAGRERDVLEAVGRAEVVDLRAEDAPVGRGAGGLVEHGRPPGGRWPEF